MQDEKPAYILNQILEDYKSCVEIPAEKRPDSLFSAFKGDFTVKIPFSKLISCHFSELLENYLNNKYQSLIAIDIVYDVPPTCEKVLSLLGNLTQFKNFEVTGLIAAHGWFYTAYLKTLEQWKSFNDSKVYSWVNLVWNFCTSSSYPVMIVLANGTAKGSPGFLSKIDLDAMQKFSKLQDSRIKLTFTEEKVSEAPRRELKNEDIYKEYSSEYARRTQESLKKASFEEKVNFYNEKEEKKPYKLEKSMKEKASSSKKLESEKKVNTREYIRTIQDYTVSDKPAATSRNRNFSSEPVINQSAHSKSYKDYLNYKASKIDAKETAEKNPKPGILKTSSIDATDLKLPYSSFSSLTSPKDFNLTRTFRESTEKFDEERTEKPNSILRNTWMHEKKESVDKKVNFSDCVFEIDDSIKGQMPEIKFSSGRSGKSPSKSSYDLEKGVKKALNSYRPTDYKSELATSRVKNEVNSYSSLEITSPSRTFRPTEVSSDYLSGAEVKNSWFCPKCSKSISNATYECASCRYINWDRFYALKSKEPKVRSESHPARAVENGTFSKTLGSVYFENRAGKETWRPGGDELKIPEKYVPGSFGRMTSREFRYDR